MDVDMLDVEVENAGHLSLLPPPVPLRQAVTEALEAYFACLGGHESVNLYSMFIEEVELPLFDFVMRHVNDNQTQAAQMLGMNRSTLRKKLKQYGLIA